MKKYISLLLLLIIATWFVGFLMGENRNTLYVLQFVAIDESTGEAIDANVIIEDLDKNIFPSVKDVMFLNSSRGVIVDCDDDSKVIALLGRSSSNSVRVPISAEGYESNFVELAQEKAGLRFMPNNKVKKIPLKAIGPHQQGTDKERDSGTGKPSSPE